MDAVFFRDTSNMVMIRLVVLMKFLLLSVDWETREGDNVCFVCSLRLATWFD